MEQNVKLFLEKSAYTVGKAGEETFYENTKCECGDLGIESPIEQLFYCAIKTLQRLNFIADSDPIEFDGKYYLFGLDVNPQTEINKYRVDFLITNWRTHHGQHSGKQIVVECDSQGWHERTEDERRREKTRDRFLIKQGYKVFHFTGKEIIEGPYVAAREVLAYVMGWDDLGLVDMPGDP